MSTIRLYNEYSAYTKIGAEIGERQRKHFQTIIDECVAEGYDLIDLQSIIMSELEYCIAIKRITIGMERRVYERKQRSIAEKASETSNSGEQAS